MRRCFLFCLAFLIQASSDVNQTFTVSNGDIIVYDLEWSDIGNDLIGGQPVDPKNWISSFASTQSGSGCTATLLGAQVLQLAAHCVGNGRTAVIKANGTSYTGTCTHAPGYRRNSTADWALCKMGQPVEREWYERVLVKNDKFKVGDKIKLVGAGCTNKGGGGGSFGTLRQGDSTVTKLPSGSNNDTVTSGGAALCFGDSGGASYYVEGDKRWVIGVNSRGNIRDTSYLSSTFTSEAVKFYSEWASKNGVDICGVNANAAKCQGDKEGPGPEPGQPLPSHCRLSLDTVSVCLYGKPRLALTDPKTCREKYAELFACEEIAERE